MTKTDDVAGLVERLRELLGWLTQDDIALRLEAADALQSAAAKIARLRGALEEYADDLCEFGKGHPACGYYPPDVCQGCAARAALAQQGGDDGQ